jgi:hypothetical protein
MTRAPHGQAVIGAPHDEAVVCPTHAEAARRSARR